VSNVKHYINLFSYYDHHFLTIYQRRVIACLVVNNRIHKYTMAKCLF